MADRFTAKESQQMMRIRTLAHTFPQHMPERVDEILELAKSLKKSIGDRQGKTRRARGYDRQEKGGVDRGGKPLDEVATEAADAAEAVSED